mgnify:FL=1
MKFQQKVFALCKLIPKGKVSTYKEIALKLNCKAYQAVGNALNKNRSQDVPCHRVIRSDLIVGGFYSGTNEKIKILKSEGIKIVDNKIDKSCLHYFK